MTSIIELFNSLFGSLPFMFAAVCVSIAVKTSILALFIKKGIHVQKISKPLIFLLLAIIGTLVCNFGWLFKLVHTLFFPTGDYTFIRFWIRLSWAFHLVQFNAYSLFIETLLEQHHRYKFRQIIFLIMSSCFFLYFFIMAIIHFDLSPTDISFEALVQKIEKVYALFIMLPFSILLALYRLRTFEGPLILKQQLSVFIKAFIVPMLVLDIIAASPFNFWANADFANAVYHSFSTLLTAYMFYYCAQKLVGLRFLNLSSHVRTPQIAYNFIDNFKDVLEQLGHVTSTKELGHIIQTFFKDSFDISLNRTKLYLRKVNAKQHEDAPELSDSTSMVEHFLSTNTENSKSFEFIKKTRVLIYDEIAFTNFYEPNETNAIILKFLDSISADIFLPIFDKNTLIACIIIERHARINQFYTDIERDEMIVLASYLGNIINLLNHRNLKSLLYQEKEVKDELGGKQQEIVHYKESLQSFIKNIKKRELGIIIYKNRRFTFSNQMAEELVDIDLNLQEGHPFTRTLKQLAKHVQEYKISHTVFAQGAHGQLVITGIPALDQNAIIITVSPPEVSDLIRKDLDTLKDPTKWDYLLYLETTKSGQIVNQLIPGSSEIPLNFKIEFLKAALRKKAILLEMPNEDLLPSVLALHQISSKEVLQVINIENFSNDPQQLATKLFGNPSIPATDQEPPMLTKLDQTGTLFLKNIHLMSMELQQYLTEFIKYGFYHNYGSDQKISSSVNIICSTSQNLAALAQEDKFSSSLLAELNNNLLSMPALATLSDPELYALAQDFIEQALSTQTFKNLLEFTERETYRLIQPPPSSFAELKARVEQLLMQKTKRNQLPQENSLSPAYTTNDPELVEAARLGKHALKDPKIMALLWEKFKNQNKIATFLGVNRSSINRRLKDFNLD